MVVLKLRVLRNNLNEIEIIGMHTYPIKTKFELDLAKSMVMILVLLAAEKAEECNGYPISKSELESPTDETNLIIYTSYRFKSQAELKLIAATAAAHIFLNLIITIPQKTKRRRTTLLGYNRFN